MFVCSGEFNLRGCFTSLLGSSWIVGPFPLDPFVPFSFFSVCLIPFASDATRRCSLHVDIVDGMVPLLTVSVVCVLRALARDLLLRLAETLQLPSRCWIFPEVVTSGSHTIHSESPSTSTPTEKSILPSIISNRTLDSGSQAAGSTLFKIFRQNSFLRQTLRRGRWCLKLLFNGL